MPRKKKHQAPDDIEQRLNRVRTIAEMERLAGIDERRAARAAFWRPFAQLPGKQALDAGRAALTTMIRTRIKNGELSLI